MTHGDGELVLRLRGAGGFASLEGPDLWGVDGTGLGLAICKSIVGAHGGTIGVTSDGQRVRFEINLPA